MFANRNQKRGREVYVRDVKRRELVKGESINNSDSELFWGLIHKP